MGKAGHGIECLDVYLATCTQGQAAATVHLEQFPAPFLCSPLSPFLSLASCFISSVAVFQGPRHAYQGGDDLYPGVDLWPFSMLLSPLLRLPHLLRDQVYFRLSLPGPQHLCLIDSVHCCPTQPTRVRTHTRTHTHTHTTLLSSSDLAWCPGDLVPLGSCFYRASPLAPPQLRSIGFLDLQ